MSQPKKIDSDLITDKTLDEIIVAYLAEDETPTVEAAPIAISRENTQPLTQADLEAIHAAGERFLAETEA